MFYLTICEEPSFLNLILFIKNIIDIVGTIVPIILIIMVTIDLLKIITDVNEKNIKDCSKKMLNRIIASIIVFFVPILVNTIMNLLEESEIQKTACWTNANTDTINKFTIIKEAKKLAELKEKQDKIRENNEKREKDDKERQNNIVKKSGGGKKLLETAMKELGNNYSKYTEWYGTYDDWCAMFASWVTAHTSITENTSDCNGSVNGSDKCYYKSMIDIRAAMVYQFAEWMANHNRFYHSEYWANKMGTYKDNGKVYEPQPGDFIFFDGKYIYGDVYHGNPKNCIGGLSHIAIVKEIKNGQVYWVGGNQDGNSYTDIYYRTSKVSINSYDMSSSYIVGYGTWPK